ncbi:MAG: type I-MYXAN CRISPR-associated endonuclease Cas1 [Deltaproteobacteria bacterium]|nr:type I-MYXAN CRISPR-associated endonuclease Cas1 [Deltaproteobacteria bacterium]
MSDLAPPEPPTLRVMALHALAYCERLFYLEEVEEIRVADAAVFVDLTVESAILGLRGRFDAVRRRDGGLYPVEHKKGRSRKGDDGAPAPWDSDRLQAAAYALLLEEHAGRPIAEARIRYHKDNVTVRLPITEAERRDVAAAVARARALAVSPDRPPVPSDERRCVRCSLAPVCLPEETRLARAIEDHAPEQQTPTPVRLYPPDTERRSLHVVTQGARVGRSGEAFSVAERGEKAVTVGAREVSDIVLHGFAQISTQALRLCAGEEIPVHWVTTSGAHIGAFGGHSGGVQRRIRQYRGLCDDALALRLARRLVLAKLGAQLRYVLRATRKADALRAQMSESIATLRTSLRGAARAPSRDSLRGHEGTGSRAYFAALAGLVVPEAGDAMRPQGRTRRPPEDRFNALLSFGYGLLLRDVLSAILRVGLEPAFGFMHQPRSAASPLALDLMELFRVPVVDLAVLGAVNRRAFDPAADFAVAGKQIWLSDQGRPKMIEAYERRKHEEYRHDAVGYSLSYARMMELEVRLLEKEWSGEPGLFARLRLR